MKTKGFAVGLSIPSDDQDVQDCKRTEQNTHNEKVSQAESQKSGNRLLQTLCQTERDRRVVHGEQGVESGWKGGGDQIERTKETICSETEERS